MATRRGILKWTGVAALGGALATLAGARGAAAANPYYSGPPSDHFDGLHFFNPGGTPPGTLIDVLKWQFGEGMERWKRPVPAPTPTVPERRVDDLRVTMIGHASMLLQCGGRNVLLDPVFSERASPLPLGDPLRFNPPGIAFNDLPPIDLVLISHNHYDHLDVASLKRLVAAHDPEIVTPLGNDTIIHGAAPEARVQAIDWGEAVEAGGLRITAEPAHHWSARGLNDRRKALWAAFVIESAGDTPGFGRVYHVGDTGYFAGNNYREAKEKYGGFRLAILPIGAYAPRWFMAPQHQNPPEALAGFLECGAETMVAHHWGTFQLTGEPWDEPPAMLREAMRERGVGEDRVGILRPGEWYEPPKAVG